MRCPVCWTRRRIGLRNWARQERARISVISSISTEVLVNIPSKMCLQDLQYPWHVPDAQIWPIFQEAWAVWVKRRALSLIVHVDRPKKFYSFPETCIYTSHYYHIPVFLSLLSRKIFIAFIEIWIKCNHRLYRHAKQESALKKWQTIVNMQDTSKHALGQHALLIWLCLTWPISRLEIICRTIYVQTHPQQSIGVQIHRLTYKVRNSVSV